MENDSISTNSATRAVKNRFSVRCMRQSWMQITANCSAALKIPTGGGQFDCPFGFRIVLAVRVEFPSGRLDCSLIYLIAPCAISIFGGKPHALKTRRCILRKCNFHGAIPPGDFPPSARRGNPLVFSSEVSVKIRLGSLSPVGGATPSAMGRRCFFLSGFFPSLSGSRGQTDSTACAREG